MKVKEKILYLSYNGMLEPLGESQVLSYLLKLSTQYEYHLISLEKPNDLKDNASMERIRSKVSAHGIHWSPMVYGTTKIGKLLNLVRFTLTAFGVVRKENIKYIHVRSYLPAISAYIIQKFINVKYLFDTRGFTFDERFDTGSLRRGTLLHRIMKWLEVKLYQNASGINKLSNLGKDTILKDELFTGGRNLKNISVIPTCVDLDRFKFYKRTFQEPFTLGYVGTAVGWYDFDKTARVLSEILRTCKVKILVFNGGQHEFIKKKLLMYNIYPEDFKIEKVQFEDMPKRLKEIDLAVYFIHPYFSKKASAATKLAELFASGIPVITNKDVGDQEYFIEKFKVGKIVDFNSLAEYEFKTILHALLNVETSRKCRQVAEEYFSLAKGAEEYVKLYNASFFNNKPND